MRKFLARLITAFAKLVTFPLSPDRRTDTLARVLAGFDLRTVQAHTRNGVLVFDARTSGGCRRGLAVLRHEPDTIGWIDAMPGDACFWDIGANVGAFTLYAALEAERRVVAMEPSAASYAVLIRNIELNGMDDRVAAYCLALAQETKLDVLNMANTGAGEAMHGFGVETDQCGNAIAVAFRQSTMGFSIDDFTRLFAPPLPSHVKIDVDGIEAEILRGGRETLSARSVKSMIVEIEGDLGSDHNREILALMSDLGFTARTKESPKYRNVIFDRR